MTTTSNTITIEYSSSVKTMAGWREVTILATAEKTSEKMAKVIEVLEIGGESPNYDMSRTGANRQKYNGIYFAKAQIGANKRLSSVKIK